MDGDFMSSITEKKYNSGFTMAEMLIVVAIIAVLVAISIPIFTGRLEKSREAVDMSHMRQAKSAMSIGLMTGDVDADTWYYYEPSSGKLSTSEKPQAYGKASNDASTFWMGTNDSAVGVPKDKVLKVSITESGVMSYKWGNAYGSTYKAMAESDLASKKTLLTSETSQERLEADRDVLFAIGESFLGMDQDRLLDLISNSSTRNNRNNNVRSSTGVVLFTYRENGTKDGRPNPQIRAGESGNMELLSQFGYANSYGSYSASNQFANSETRALFSDFCNEHNIDVQVVLGNVKYDSNGKVAEAEVWIKKTASNVSDTPAELKNIVVKVE